MISAQSFLQKSKNCGFRFYTGTPCSYLKPFINSVINDEHCSYSVAVNEGEAVGLATGAWLAGTKSVVMFQNSGLGNAVNPITSLSKIFHIPFLGVVTHRGEPSGPSDEPQHQLMGGITTDLLDLMEIPWDDFPDTEEEIEGALQKANKIIENDRSPYFFVMKKGQVEKEELDQKAFARPRRPSPPEAFDPTLLPVVSRTQALKSIMDTFPDETAFIATTGKTGRELFELNDKSNQFYMVGSMGLAPSIATGIKFCRPKQKVCVIDGDGALLMRTGALATTGYLNPDSYYHILLNNGVHDSTGGQGSFSEHVDFALIAKACGFGRTFTTADEEELRSFLQNDSGNGPVFIHFRILPGSPKDLGRPTVTPAEVATRFRHFLLN